MSMQHREREDLQRLVRQREKVLKSAAKQQTAELIADFENQMGSEYSFDQDSVWEAAAEAAQKEVAKAQKLVAARCRELGIPDRFAPSLNLVWHNRGYANTIDKRKEELRRMAQTRIEANEKRAIVQIELSCLDAQTRIATVGLTSEAARSFLEALPSIEALMPQLSFAEVAGEAEPPVAEQLVSPNALRQRKWRDKQLALRNGQTALCNGPEKPGVMPMPMMLGRLYAALRRANVPEEEAREASEEAAGYETRLTKVESFCIDCVARSN
jgi:hypothetical protein